VIGSDTFQHFLHFCAQVRAVFCVGICERRVYDFPSHTPRSVRAFVKLRQFALVHHELAAKLEQLESKVTGHDDAIRQLVAAIRALTTSPADPPRRKIGFGRSGE
jgi:hypothetical protein